MTTVHRTGAWQALRRRAYPIIKASLPAPCVYCGRIVDASTPWHVGHIVADSMGGDLTLSNLGPVHQRCNLSDGGRIGAAKANARRRARRSLPGW